MPPIYCSTREFSVHATNSYQLLEKMSKDNKVDASQGAGATEKLREAVQEKVDAGWELPCGWLFKT